MSHQTRLPTLGPRGEGWVLIQGFLLVAIAAAGSTGPAWSGDLHLATSGAGLLLILAGAILAVRGLADLRENLTPFPRPRDGATLHRQGVYRFVRHPIYSGVILAGLGWSALPRTMIDETLSVVQIKKMKIDRTLGIVTHAARTLSNAAQALVRTVHEAA